MKIISNLNRALLTGAATLVLLGPAAHITGIDGLKLVRPAAAAIQISFFYDRLGDHGSWVNHRRYGYVFVPAVRSGWRPYTHGHWVYTRDYGWYWVSDEPFGWAVYHYGRWSYDPSFGWIWVPGNVWGPAWVTWRYGGGHVGWAPMAPPGNGYVYGTPDYYEPPIVEAWVFVPESRFVAPDVVRYVAPVVEINLFLGKARERHHTRYRDGRAYNPFLPRERVRDFTKNEINIYNVTVVDDPRKRSKDRRKGDEHTIEAFQAEVSKEKPKEKPKKVARTPDEVKSKPRLEETAKGEKPEGAPPSAAELKPESGTDQDAPERRDAKAKQESERDAQTKQESKEAPGAEAEKKQQPDESKEAKTKPVEDKPERPKQNERRKSGDGEADKPKPQERKAARPEKADDVKPDRGKAKENRGPKEESASRQPQAPEPEERKRGNAGKAGDSDKGNKGRKGKPTPEGEAASAAPEQSQAQQPEGEGQKGPGDGDGNPGRGDRGPKGDGERKNRSN